MQSRRSGPKACDWMQAQFGGGKFYDHVNEMLASPSKLAMLEECGFTMPIAETIPDMNDIMLLDDEMADLLGQMSFAMPTAWVKRCLTYLKGWPHQFIKFTLPPIRRCRRQWSS